MKTIKSLALAIMTIAAMALVSCNQNEPDAPDTKPGKDTTSVQSVATATLTLNTQGAVLTADDDPTNNIIVLTFTNAKGDTILTVDADHNTGSIDKTYNLPASDALYLAISASQPLDNTKSYTAAIPLEYKLTMTKADGTLEEVRNVSKTVHHVIEVGEADEYEETMQHLNLITFSAVSAMNREVYGLL